MTHRTVLTALALGLALAPAGAEAQAGAPVHVRVTAHVVVVDREAAARAGVSYVALADGRVQLTERTGRRGGAAVQGPLGVRAFLDLARERRWTRSESTQTVLVVSGGAARVASLDAVHATFASRTRGPSLTVVPTVLADGSVHLRVRAGVEDRLETPWGGHDASPAWVESEVVGRSGEEITVASSAVAVSGARRGVLHVATLDRTRDVLVVVTPVVVD
jgi:hypothetical protein